MADEPRHLVRTGTLTPDDAVRIRHPLNPNSDVRMLPLSDRVGMARVQLSLARVPPGRESFIPHAHSVQEEFLFILEGRGTAQIGDVMVEVGPGDYMGFPTDGVIHHLTNTGDVDLVYLMGGERTATEVSVFPAIGKMLTVADGQVRVFDTEAALHLTREDFLVKDGGSDPDGTGQNGP